MRGKYKIRHVTPTAWDRWADRNARMAKRRYDQMFRFDGRRVRPPVGSLIKAHHTKGHRR